MKLKSFMILVGLAATGIAAYSLHSQLTPKPLRSFVVTSVMSSPKSDSPYLSTTTFTTAVRTDGSWVEIWPSHAGGREWHERDIRDFNTGTYTVVDDITQSLTTKAIAPHDLTKQRLQPATSCQGTSDGRILGLDVIYTEDKGPMEAPAGTATSVVKRWLAPDLGCFVLRKETAWTRDSDGALLVDTKITPISVVFQAVDQFFAIPPNYQERSPGQVMRLRATLYPNDFAVPPDTTGIDKAYQVAHDKLPKH